MSRGRFYLRCESNEWEFLAGLQAPVPFDAAVICDRYLAEYPRGHGSFGEPRDRLTMALDAHGVRWSVDPETARLEHARSRDRQSPRAGNRPIARALPLPLSAERLGSDEAIDAIVEAADQHQLGSPAFTAPYLEVGGLDDPRLQINLRSLSRSREIAGDRAVIAYLQVLGSRLRDGTARHLAVRLAQHGADVIFVRVRRFGAEQATADELVAYASVVEAGTRAGARVVADCVGRLGPALVATGADGFSTNARCFRKVPDDLHPVEGGGGAGPLLWEVPGGGLGVSVGPVTATCHVAGCPAPSGPVPDRAAVRVHDLHEFHNAARQAAAEELGYAARLLRSASPIVRGWGRALQRLERRAA